MDLLSNSIHFALSDVSVARFSDFFNHNQCFLYYFICKCSIFKTPVLAKNVKHRQNRSNLFSKKDAHRNLTKFAPGFVHTAPIWSRFMKKLFCTILGKGFTGKLVKNIGPANKKRRQGTLQPIHTIHTIHMKWCQQVRPGTYFYTRRGSG